MGSQVFPEVIGPPIRGDSVGQRIALAISHQSMLEDQRLLTPDLCDRLAQEAVVLPDDSDDRKETEQLPLTRDLLGPSSSLARQAAFHLREQFSQVRPSRGGDESDEMHGVEVEVSDGEKYHA